MRYDYVLSLDPVQPDALHLKGLARHAAGDSDAGVDLISRAIQSQGVNEPTAATMWSNLGEVYRARNDLDKARSAHERAVALQPLSAATQFNYAEMLMDAGDLAEALDR